MIGRLRCVIWVMMGSHMRNVVRCGVVGNSMVRGRVVGKRVMRGGMRWVWGVGIVRMFLLSVNEWVVIRVQVEFIESGLSFAVHVVPMVALKSLLVEEGAIRA